MRFTVTLCAGLCLATATLAQPYPSKPITLVVPQPAGGAIDLLARGLGDELGKRLGVMFVIDNKPGASGMLGAQAVARAAPDGYTLLLTNSTPILTVPFMFAKVPYDVKKDFSLVTQISGAEMALAVNSEVPAKNMTEFIAWARRTPGVASYGSPGIGTLSHLEGAYLTRSRDIDMTHVPFKGEGQMIQELAAGRIAWSISTLGSLLPQVQAGRVRPLALIAQRRVKELPDVPTMQEAGLTDPEFCPMGWIGLIAPSGTPGPILERLEREARLAVATPAMQQRLDAIGATAIGSSSQDFRKEVDALTPVVERMVRISGAKLD